MQRKEALRIRTEELKEANRNLKAQLRRGMKGLLPYFPKCLSASAKRMAELPAGMTTNVGLCHSVA